MSICIPSASCGVTGPYVSNERGVTFVTGPSDTCIKSDLDYTPGTLGSDCSTDNYGCNTGFSCALNIDDGAGNDLMTICIPIGSCGVIGTYISAERGVNFDISDTDTCIPSGTEGTSCSNDKDSCDSTLVCALDIDDDGAGNN